MRMRHEFVDYIPERLSDGIVYVSLRFGTVVHSCACGCGEEVVTPLGPAEWKLTYDGLNISLAPSIGNWGFRCRSHYWVEDGSVRWARGFSELEVAEVREDARRRRAVYYDRRGTNQDGSRGPGKAGGLVRLVGRIARTLGRSLGRGGQ